MVARQTPDFHQLRSVIELFGQRAAAAGPMKRPVIPLRWWVPELLFGPLSTTVVFGLRTAVERGTNRPVTVLRALPFICTSVCELPRYLALFCRAIWRYYRTRVHTVEGLGTIFAGRAVQGACSMVPNSVAWVPAVVATPDLLELCEMSVSKKRPQPGPGAPLTSEREQYRRLMVQGLNNHQACLKIGVHPTTGTRWSKGRTLVDHTGKSRYYPPVHADPVVYSPRYLSEDERILIGDLLAAGHTRRSIAGQLRRSPSTISREIRRNTSGAGNYRPFGAHRKALARRPRPRSGKLARDNEL